MREPAVILIGGFIIFSLTVLGVAAFISSEKAQARESREYAADVACSAKGGVVMRMEGAGFRTSTLDGLCVKVLQ